MIIAGVSKTISQNKPRIQIYNGECTMRECKICLNTTANPTIKILDDGLCNVCHEYKKYFNIKRLETELNYLKTLQSKDGKIDCMVGLSGGKDSTAMLYNLLEMGFHPLCFTFQLGYNNMDDKTAKRVQMMTKKLGVPYLIIDVHRYVGTSDRQNFNLLENIYSKPVNDVNREVFRKLYSEGRNYYSTKNDIVFPFIRPCQICRKIAIRAYYHEAVKRNIRIVFLGINEWASYSKSQFSAIRVIRPKQNDRNVLIVHFPYLIQRKYKDLQEILRHFDWDNKMDELDVNTGGKYCLLARACEKKAGELLGFHIDSMRLSREITVGFISKEQALAAIKDGYRDSERSLQEVLELSGLCDKRDN